MSDPTNKPPKSFADALSELENLSQTAGPDLRARLHKELHDLEERYRSFKPKFEEELGKTKDHVESKIKDNPWLTLGVVGLLAFVIGFLFSNRSND